MPSTPDTPSDVELMRRIAAGDREAFAEFYDRVAGLAYSVAFRILGRAEEAEDAVQEAFVAVWRNAGSFNVELGQPSNWAVATTRNKSIDRLRKEHRRSRVIDETLEFDDERTAVDESESNAAGDDEPLHNQLRRALAGLPMEQRRPIDLAFFGGLTQPEIAAELRLPLGTVKARIRRGLLRLRSPLQTVQLELR